MTPHDKSRYSFEAMKTMNLLTNRALINIDKWNSRTVWKTGKANQVAE